MISIVQLLFYAVRTNMQVKMGLPKRKAHCMGIADTQIAAQKFARRCHSK